MRSWRELWGRLGARFGRVRAGAPDAGSWGEAVAERRLRELGFRILGRRVRLSRRDELDIVARDGEVLVFVEVKTRRSEAFGSPASAVGREKRRTLSRAAVRYLQRAHAQPVNFRFDIVEVVGAPGGEPRVRVVRDAFPLDRRYSLPF